MSTASGQFCGACQKWVLVSSILQMAEPRIAASTATPIVRRTTIFSCGHILAEVVI